MARIPPRKAKSLVDIDNPDDVEITGGPEEGGPEEDEMPEIEVPEMESPDDGYDFLENVLGRDRPFKSV